MTKKILIADDDPAIRDFLKFILEEQGYLIETSLDNLICSRIIQHNSDLVLLDIWMSGEEGTQTCKYLKTHPATCQVPIILISANSDNRRFARESGADDFLQKPFKIQDLLQKVHKQLMTTPQINL